MLAKLFNNITVQSLARALGFSLVLILLVSLMTPSHEAELVIGLAVFGISGTWYDILFGSIVFITAILLSSGINGLGFLKKDYQFIPVFTLVLLPLYFYSPAPGLILVLPLGALLVLRLLALAQGAEDSYVLFDVGTLMGLMAILVPESTLFLLVAWLGVLSLSKIYFRAFLMPLLGIAAVWFIGFTLLFWLSDASSPKVAEAILARVDVEFSPTSLPSDWWKLVPMALAVLPALLEVMQVYGKASVYKRQSFTFLLLFFLVFAVSGAFLVEQSHIWMWMGIPAAVFVVNHIHYLRKKWAKDIPYLLLLLTLLLFLFF